MFGDESMCSIAIAREGYADRWPDKICGVAQTDVATAASRSFRYVYDLSHAAARRRIGKHQTCQCMSVDDCTTARHGVQGML